jgi:hypothetical protein
MFLKCFAVNSRFFHARACSPEAAFQQFKESFNTRQLVDDVATYENIEVEDYESTRKLVSQKGAPASQN